MRETRYTRTSTQASVGYKNPRKPLMSKSERKRQAESLITYRPGGDDAS